MPTEQPLADLIQTYWKLALLADLAKARFRPTGSVELSTIEEADAVIGPICCCCDRPFRGFQSLDFRLRSN